MAFLCTMIVCAMTAMTIIMIVAVTAEELRKRK